MKLLIEKGLMFGSLVPVRSPTMVARYGAALEKVTGRRTTLTEFHIDLAGFSPEVGDELGDLRYLAPQGASRSFILLGLEQREAPLIQADFSTTEGVLRRFIEENRAPLTALTAREAVIGEISAATWRLGSVADVVALRALTIEADTPSGRVADGARLQRMVEQFRADDDLWHDDAFIGEMIALTARTGDILAEPLVLRATEQTLGNLHTAAFGGLYVFRDARSPFLLAREAGVLRDRLKGIEQFPLADTAAVGQALELNRLVEPLAPGPGLNAAAILRQKLDFMLVDALAATAEGPDDLSRLTRTDLRRIAQRANLELPPAFATVADALARVEAGQPPNLPAYTDPGCFYLLRGAPGPDRDLVNRLLTEFTPLDFRQLYICNKPAFYAAWRGWPARKQTYVAEFLVRNYAMDKAAVRAQLFGTEPAAGTGETPAARRRGAAPWGSRAKE